jgi:hypothetical protein
MVNRIGTTLLAGLLLAATGGWAQETSAETESGSSSGFTFAGTLGLGGQFVATSDTVDEGKMREYRDLTDGILSLIDIRGRGNGHWLDFYAENVGRTDMSVDLSGGTYGTLKYQLFSDSLEHFFGTGMRTPYEGAGTDTQRAVLPNLDPTTWNTYDLAYQRRNDGGMIEYSFSSPFYVRADVNQLSFDGNKLQAYAQGTGSGNGFVDLATPVDWATQNLSLEAGYASPRLHFSLNYLDSQFDNENRLLTWTNGYFENDRPPATANNLGIDTSYLAPDSDMKRVVANGVIKKLPLNSTLAVRYTTTETTTNELMGTSQLYGSATTISTAPFLAIPGTFEGDIQHDTWALSWFASPGGHFDFRVWANDFERENDSTHVVFTGFNSVNQGLGCVGTLGGTGAPGTSNGPRLCENEPFAFDRMSVGGELSWKPNRENRITAGYEELDTEREFHPDSDETHDERLSVEWRNMSLDTLAASVKYTHIDRTSNYLAPQLPNTVWSFDVANSDRDVVKVDLDFTPSDVTEFSLEYYYKKNDYSESASGRLADDRNEIYLSAGFGPSDGFRFKIFADYDTSTTDARLVNRNSTTGAINYTVFTDVDDEYLALGAGFDWPVMEGLLITGSVMWDKSEGTVEFDGIPGVQALPTTLVDIPNYGNNDKLLFNFKGTYDLPGRWGLIAGLAYEDVNFDDIQFDPYLYVLPPGTLTGSAQATASYLSGWYRDPAYEAIIGSILVTYHF